MVCSQGNIHWITADLHSEHIAVVIAGIQLSYTIKIGLGHPNLILSCSQYVLIQLQCAEHSALNQ